MERYISKRIYEQVLLNQGLPTPQEFYNSIVEVESKIFIEDFAFDSQIEKVAWYLFSVCISKESDATYGEEKINSGLRVCAHVFDLISRKKDLPPEEKQLLILAAQYAYLLIAQEPFSTAIYKRRDKFEIKFPERLEGVAIEIGMSLLAFDVQRIYGLHKSVADGIAALQTASEFDLSNTPFRAIEQITKCAKHIVDFLVYGKDVSIAKYHEAFERIPLDFVGYSRLELSLVATIIQKIEEKIVSKSLWKELEGKNAESVIRSFTSIHPRVLSLWQPQLDVISKIDSIIQVSSAIGANRLFLSTPTSSGKTLISQLIISLFLNNSFRKVIYVAPTRALCREVGDNLQSRMRYLRKKVLAEMPDFLDETDLLPHDFSVEVMTPERLLNKLRADRTSLISEVGMYVFDEVHNIENGDRGGVYEECISIVNHNAAESNAKIVMISAVTGNKSSFIEWIGGETHVHVSDSNWLGSRRIKGIYYTVAKEWTRSGDTSKAQLRGVIDLKIGEEDSTSSFSFNENVGELYLRDRKKLSKSTSNYMTQIPLIKHLRSSGPVLVVAATKDMAVLIAKALCDSEYTETPIEITEFLLLAEAKLGANHALIQTIKHGVAFHHGALPVDIRSGIEDLLRSGYIDVLVSTTTMIEGVNLAVRSVLISAQGSHGRDGYSEYITGKTLLNAIGRAGRAGKETEGIVILAINTRPDSSHINLLSPPIESLSVQSNIFTNGIFVEWESHNRSDPNWVFKVENRSLQRLTSMIWFALAESESNRGADENAMKSQAINLIESTFGWNQLDSEQKSQIAAMIDSVISSYTSIDPQKRIIWSKSSQSIRSAKEVTEISEFIYELISESSDNLSNILIREDIIAKYFETSEAPRIGFRKAKNAQIGEIRIDYSDLMRRWIGGEEVASISQSLFADQVKDETFAVDQLNDFIYTVFEVFLPPFVSRIIDSIVVIDDEIVANKDICGYIRWGVNSKTSISLISNGLYSRTLASKISKVYDSEEREILVLDWLRSLDITQYVELFQCTRSELKNLLHLCRSDFPISWDEFLNGDSAEFPITPHSNSDRIIENVQISLDLQTNLFEIPLMSGDMLLGHISPQFIPEIEGLLISGIPCKFTYKQEGSSAKLLVQSINS